MTRSIISILFTLVVLQGCAHTCEWFCKTGCPSVKVSNAISVLDRNVQIMAARCPEAVIQDLAEGKIICDESDVGLYWDDSGNLISCTPRLKAERLIRLCGVTAQLSNELKLWAEEGAYGQRSGRCTNEE